MPRQKLEPFHSPGDVEQNIRRNYAGNSGYFRASYFFRTDSYQPRYYNDLAFLLSQIDAIQEVINYKQSYQN